MAKIGNRVTEKAAIGSRLYVVSATWRGGHDLRLFRLEEVFSDRQEAQARWEQLTEEAHLANCPHRTAQQAQFERLPLRTFLAERE